MEDSLAIVRESDKLDSIVEFESVEGDESNAYAQATGTLGSFPSTQLDHSRSSCLDVLTITLRSASRMRGSYALQRVDFCVSA